jgi:DNA polymerase-3 subunit epsilon/ATP-dependent DNA helicase DinG
VNHALLLSDIVSGAKVLPEYRHLIVDEAHHLEAEATNQLSSQVTRREFLDYLNRIEGRRGGLLTRLRERLLFSDIIPLRRSHLEQLSTDLLRQVSRAKEWVSQLFAVLLRFLEAHTEEQGEYERHLRLTGAVRRQGGWSDVELVWDNLSSELRGISDMLNELYIALEDLSGERFPDCEALMLEISSLLHSGERLQHCVNLMVSRPEANDIYWLSLGRGNGSLSLCAAPLRIDNFLKEHLFSEKESVVLTGATLSTGGNFEYIKGCLGLDDVDELLLGAPFDYSSSALIYIPSDIPEPGEGGYQQAVDEALIELCSAVGGRTLVLFTSHSALRSTLTAIRPPLEMRGILVLGHGVDGSPKQLLEIFKAEPKAVLLGTASFWEGVDVVGEVLSVVVITRLPFNVPTEPIFAARSEAFADPFDGYALPQAALRFKQGVGRLIRSKSDRGVMVILDSRIKNRYYGSVFLKSLPPCTVVSGARADLPATALRWLEGSRRGYARDL